MQQAIATNTTPKNTANVIPFRPADTYITAFLFNRVRQEAEARFPGAFSRITLVPDEDTFCRRRQDFVSLKPRSSLAVSIFEVWRAEGNSFYVHAVPRNGGTELPDADMGEFSAIADAIDAIGQRLAEEIEDA